MEEIKRVLKRGCITSIVILLFGILMQNKYIYVGMFSGSVLSVIGFYMICLDAKASLVSKSPFKVGVIGYMKRYVLYGILLALLTKYEGFPMLVSGVIGLLMIKFNIQLMTLFNNINKFKSKYLK